MLQMQRFKLVAMDSIILNFSRLHVSLVLLFSKAPSMHPRMASVVHYS